jgi:hypothetical protein
MAENRTSQNRIFTYTEASALLPEVRELTEDARVRVENMGAGASPEEIDDATDAVVRAWARSLVGMGLEVKGLWLVDFDNGSGYYCWRHPEPGLHFFHSYEEGFTGRMRIQ